MKVKIIFYAVLIIVLAAGCGRSVQERNSRQDFIDLYLEQDGKIINIIDDTAEIKKKQFRFIFNFNQPDSVLLNASFNPWSFESAAAGSELSTIPGLKNTGIAEELFNPDYSMFVSDDSPNYWYYSDESDSRFDSVTKEDGGYRCKRTISSLINLDSDGQKQDITKIPQETIYIVIARIEWNEDFTKMIERSRRYLKIKFIP